MIDKKELEKNQKNIMVVKDELSQELPKLQEFLSKFPKDKLGEMKKEEYVVGFGKESSTFCYWLETTLKNMGNIKGGTTADKKFGIYFDKKKGEYTFLKRKFGTSKDKNEIFNNIKKEIIELLDAGEKVDIDRIKASKISPMFKGKILSTYFPKNYLNIFSSGHLIHFLNEFDLKFSDSTDEVDKRIILSTELKNKDPVMRNWTNYEFSKFLYKFYRPPKNIETIEVLNDIKNLKEQNEILKQTKELSREKMIHYLKTMSTRVSEVIIKNKSYKRDNVAIAYLKKLRGFKCQFCGCSILKKNGDLYIEGAHIIPKNRKGSELPENILILCPNHHKEFDLGKREIINREGNKVTFKVNEKDYFVDLNIN
jgi:hypothetical protein